MRSWQEALWPGEKKSLLRPSLSEVVMLFAMSPGKPRVMCTVCLSRMVEDTMLCVFKSPLAPFYSSSDFRSPRIYFEFEHSIWILHNTFLCVIWHLFWKRNQPNIRLEHTLEHKPTCMHICKQMIYTVDKHIEVMVAPHFFSWHHPSTPTTKTKQSRALREWYDPEKTHNVYLGNGVSGVISILFWGLNISKF